MRLGFALIVLLGLAAGVLLLVFKGGKDMSILRNDTEAHAGVPPSAAHLSGTFQTATFALG